jgi:hypothetical protein
MINPSSVEIATSVRFFRQSPFQTSRPRFDRACHFNNVILPKRRFCKSEQRLGTSFLSTFHICAMRMRAFSRWTRRYHELELEKTSVKSWRRLSTRMLHRTCRLYRTRMVHRTRRVHRTWRGHQTWACRTRMVHLHSTHSSDAQNPICCSTQRQF